MEFLLLPIPCLTLPYANFIFWDIRDCEVGIELLILIVYVQLIVLQKKRKENYLILLLECHTHTVDTISFASFILWPIVEHVAEMGVALKEFIVEKTDNPLDNLPFCIELQYDSFHVIDLEF